MTPFSPKSCNCPSLHKAGTFSAVALQALVRHASARPLQHSLETGSGASAPLLSHLSADHYVFAMDGGTGSIRGVESSPLLRRSAVTFVEGPTQVTLPRHTFSDRLQLVLIDGPHGYPFPDLEYYYLYPHLDPGGLLIVDDIHIPTIGNLFDFLTADEMFHLEEVVETTAFFRRTDAATFSPTGDGWWTQGYNKRAFASAPASPLVTFTPTRTDQTTPWYLDRLGAHENPMGVARLQVPRGEDLAISGWAIDTALRSPAIAVDLFVDGVGYRAETRVPRADVAAVHGDQAYMRCGFDALLPRVVATPGMHELEIRVVTSGGREYVRAAMIRFEAV